MKKIFLKDIELKENEYLYIGYFSYKGNECLMNNPFGGKGYGFQKLSGWAFEHMKENNPGFEIVKVKDGYATLFASKYVK